MSGSGDPGTGGAAYAPLRPFIWNPLEDMVELYRAEQSPLADEIEETLQDLVVAHEVIRVGSGEPRSAPAPSLPALRHGDDVVTGEEALRSYLESLQELMEDWGRFQSDSCQLDRNGRVC